jgi:hypothetical protein
MVGQTCDLKTYVLSRHQANSDLEMLPAFVMEKEKTLPSIYLVGLIVHPSE